MTTFLQFLKPYFCIAYYLRVLLLFLGLFRSITDIGVKKHFDACDTTDCSAFYFGE